MSKQSDRTTKVDSLVLRVSPSAEDMERAIGIAKELYEHLVVVRELMEELSDAEIAVEITPILP